MKKILLCIAVLFLSAATATAGGDFAREFEAVKATGDDQKIQSFLASAEEAQKTNPEYYVLAANYWWALSKKVVVSTKKPGEKDFSLTDQKTGKVAGSISEAGTVYPDIPEKAVDILGKATARFPNRADIAVGRAYMQRELGKYDETVATLEALIKTAGARPEEIRWKNNSKPDEKVSEFIPEIIQDYSGFFYNRATDADDKRCERLSKATISAFPDNPMAYNMMAGLALANKRNDEALAYLTTAYKKAPDDPIVILNLADTCAKLGKKQQAREYYKKVINSNAEEKYKKAASQKLSRVND